METVSNADNENEKLRIKRMQRRIERANLQAGVTGGALLRMESVLARVGLGKSTVYAHMAAGRFPLPTMRSRRCVRWRASDIDAWLAAQGA